MPMPRKPDPIKYCKHCGLLMARKRYRNSSECLLAFSRRVYCDKVCMAKAMIQEDVKRDTYHWRARKFRKCMCQDCGKMAIETSDGELDVHHLDGNWTNNASENLATLCGSCHLKRHWHEGKLARKRQPCKVCGDPARRSQMCQKHYQRFKKYGDPLLRKYGPHLRRVLPNV